MARLKCVGVIMLMSFFYGCASVQVHSQDSKEKKSIIRDYMVIKNTSKTWDVLEKKSFSAFRWFTSDDWAGAFLYVGLIVGPVIDFSFLPFQIIYDGLYSYRTDYEISSCISGKIVDDLGNPMAGREFNVTFFNSSQKGVCDDKGRFVENFTVTYPRAPDQVTVSLEVGAPVDTAEFAKGEKVTGIVPYKIQYRIDSSGQVSDREDLMPEVISNGTDRDVIETNWVPSAGRIIKLKNCTFISEKNRKITNTERIAEENRLKEEAKAEAIRKKQEERAERNLVPDLIDAALNHQANLEAYRMLKDMLQYQTKSKNMEKAAAELQAFVNDKLRPSNERFVSLAQKYIEKHGPNALYDLAIVSGFRDLLGR